MSVSAGMLAIALATKVLQERKRERERERERAEKERREVVCTLSQISSQKGSNYAYTKSCLT